MTTKEFYQSVSGTQPPLSLSSYLQAMWYDAKGDWEKAHSIIQDMPGRTAAWIHAYLHRKEGDIANAGYWYRRAGKTSADYSLQQESEYIIEDLFLHTHPDK